MSFTYEIFKDEEEALKAKEFKLLPPGLYDFSITKAENTFSNAGNPMIKLTHSIYHDGQDYTIFGLLVGTKNMSWLIKHFCEATGLANEYLAGTFNADMCPGIRGKVLISIDPERPKNDGSGGVWKARNIVEDYGTGDKNNAAFAYHIQSQKVKKKAATGTIPVYDDEIPF